MVKPTIAYILGWLVLFALLTAPPLRCESPLEDAFRSSEDRLIAARAVVAESGWDVSKPDAPAVLWLLTRRYARPEVRARYRTFAEFVSTYSTPLRRPRGERARAISALLPGETPAAPLRGTAHQWARVQAFVDAFARGEHPDPCRGRVDHFGSKTDGAPRHYVVVDCGPTENIYYRVVPRTLR